jgi:hypothetical protein
MLEAPPPPPSQSNHKTQVIWKGRGSLLCYSPIGEITIDENNDVSSQAEWRFRDHYRKWQVVE